MWRSLFYANCGVTSSGYISLFVNFLLLLGICKTIFTCKSLVKGQVHVLQVLLQLSTSICTYMYIHIYTQIIFKKIICIFICFTLTPLFLSSEQKTDVFSFSCSFLYIWMRFFPSHRLTMHELTASIHEEKERLHCFCCWSTWASKSRNVGQGQGRCSQARACPFLQLTFADFSFLEEKSSPECDK